MVVTKELKKYSHIPILTARVFYQRQVDKTRLNVVAEKPDCHPERLAPNIGHYAAPSSEVLRKEYASRF